MKKTDISLMLEIISELKKSEKIALELMYKWDDIIGYQKINPNTLEKIQDKNNTVWVQYPNDDKFKRILFDSQILTNY